MGGSHSKPVTVDIGKHPESRSGGQVKKDDKGYHYTDNSGGQKVNTPEKGGKIGKINKGKVAQNGFGTLTTYDSVSVFYWSGDNSFSNPLLIQLGEAEEYYKHAGGYSWNKQSSITTGTLRYSLNKQNCDRNKAHIVDLSQKHGNSSGTTYECPSCNRPSFQVYKSSDSGGTPYYGHTITSISGFKNGGKWQVGFPSLKSVSGSVIRVYCDNSDQKPIAIAQQATTTYWFRRNTSDENAWTAVATAPNQASSALSTPSVDLDLSKMDGKYNFGGTEIKMAVLLSHIGDGYYRYLYSLRGAPFKATEIKHGQGTTLSGIDTSTNPLLSVSAYYYGESPADPTRLILVELRSSGGGRHKYFHRETKDAHTWSEYSVPDQETTRLEGNALKQTLDELKKNVQFPAEQTDSQSIGQQIAEFFQFYFWKNY